MSKKKKADIVSKQIAKESIFADPNIGNANVGFIESIDPKVDELRRLCVKHNKGMIIIVVDNDTRDSTFTTHNTDLVTILGILQLSTHNIIESQTEDESQSQE